MPGDYFGEEAFTSGDREEIAEARYLLHLATTPLARDDDRGRRTISATHELLAEGTASTRESVSKIITDLRRNGLIESGYRSITLVDVGGLQITADGS